MVSFAPYLSINFFIVRSSGWSAACVCVTLWVRRCGLPGGFLPYLYDVPRAVGYLPLVGQYCK